MMQDPTLKKKLQPAPGFGGGGPQTGGGLPDTSVPQTGGGLPNLPQTGGGYTPPPVASGFEPKPQQPMDGGGAVIPGPFNPPPPPPSGPFNPAPPQTGGGFTPPPQTGGPLTPPPIPSGPAPVFPSNSPFLGGGPQSGGGLPNTSVPQASALTGGGPQSGGGLPDTSVPQTGGGVPAPPQTGGGAPPAPTPSNGLPPGATDMGNGMVRLANGAMVDRNHPLFQQAMQAGGGAAGAPGAPAPPTIRSAFQDALLKRFGTDPSNVSVDSAEINPAIRANRLAQDRGMTRSIMRLGEGGGDASSREAQVAGLMQQRAVQEGQFEGGQVADLARQRAGELTSALMLGGQFLTDQDRMALQKELGALDAQIRQSGINMQGQLGNRDLDLRDKLGSGNLNLGLLGLLQGGRQFDQNLAGQLGMFGANLNQNALLQLLGGLG